MSRAALAGGLVIKVLVVDASVVVCRTLAQQLRSDPEIDVVGVATDPYVGRDLLVRLSPDVLTLDLETPRMDGLTFLRKVMSHRPMPVVVVSSATAAGSRMALQALACGAVAVLDKPGTASAAGDFARELVTVVKTAAHVQVRSRNLELHRAPLAPLARATHQIVAIGASTGGTVALEKILAALPRDSPGIVITQHMPEAFTRTFAQRLDTLAQVEVREAADGDSVVPGVALVAPGNHHLIVRRLGTRLVVDIGAGPRVRGHGPSVDVMFRSVAEAAGKNAVGVILTGMGADGAEGLLRMRQAGAATIAEDESTCVVFGMPQAAIWMGGVEHVLPLSQIPRQILALVSERDAA